jgi:hypothetical protein
MLSVIMLTAANKPFSLSVIINVIMLSVIILSVANKPFILSFIMLSGFMLIVTNKPLY